jgi:hypothetical protein
MKNVLEKIDERLRTRIRVIIWKQWKRTKTRCEALVKLGMPFELAFNCANTRKSYQQICKTQYIKFAINNERLKKRGLLFLTDHYLKYILKYELNRRMPNGMYGCVRGAKLIKS